MAPIKSVGPPARCASAPGQNSTGAANAPEPASGSATLAACKAERLTVARGHARFAGERKVEVTGEVHEAKVIITAGVRPVVPPLDGLASTPWLDNATVMRLREVPAHLLVLGGEYIGCEFGQMFPRFGAEVTILDHHPHLVSGLLALLEKGDGRPGNLGTPVEMTLVEDAVHEAVGKGGAVRPVRALPENDPRQRRPYISRVKSLLGWQPRVPLAGGLVPMVEYVRRELAL